MYEIDELIDNGYKYIKESENVLEIDEIALKLTLKKIPCRILKDERVLIFLDGSVYQYKYWKDKYILGSEENDIEIKRTRFKIRR